MLAILTILWLRRWPNPVTICSRSGIELLNTLATTRIEPGGDNRVQVVGIRLSGMLVRFVDCEISLHQQICSEMSRSYLVDIREIPAAIGHMKERG